MKQKITNLVVFIFAFAVSIYGQKATNTVWKEIESEKAIESTVIKRPNVPSKAVYFELDLAELKTMLSNAPVFGNFVAPSSLVIEFPVADGSFQKFSVFEWSVMDKELEKKFPMIKSYAAQGIDDPTATMRFSVTQFGLHTMTLSGNTSTCFIDPYTQDANYYIVYNKASLGADTRNFVCTTDEHVELPSIEGERAGPNNVPLNANDQKLRTYRLAQTCNAEYGNIFAGTSNQVANIQAQMAITMTRVNGVYERDLSIHMNFVPNNDLLIYYGNVASDPWNGEYNTKTAQVIDAAIGISNYDIGHNFNTSGGGNAGCIGCVCQGTATTGSQNGNHKGRGYTGSSDPTGDPFDIDYVAHEMGHQFGGYHVMNTCSRSGSGQTEVEPASGSSIMGYAGICPVNVQNQSHDDFNFVNIRDIMALVKTGSINCAAITNITNSPPTANAGADYIIPKSTAFVLEGTATDANGLESLTYSWSQNDPAESPGSSAPLSNYTVGPMYRAKAPITSPNRYMPQLADVLAGNLTPTWEVTPSVGRVMNFSFLVRDNDASGGQTASDLMKVTVNGTAGPFVVTSQNTATSWDGGTPQTITWNVAGTDLSPVSCANVDILFSTDGGYTYPIVIAAGVPNSGSATISAPQVNTTTGRIMVRGSGNIFFAINAAPVTVQAIEFLLSTSTATQNNCPPNDQTFTFNYDTYAGFSETATFSATGNPAGSTVTFNPTTAVADGTPVTVTVSGLDGTMSGSYNLVITGTSATMVRTLPITLNVQDLNLPAPTLSGPVEAATDVSPLTTLTWDALPGVGIKYNVQISTDPGFATIFASASNITGTSYQPNTLNHLTTYYWRVSAQNLCTSSVSSATGSFTTGPCFARNSSNVPKTISASGTPTVNSTLMVTLAGTINDVNVVNLTGTHTRISDLSVTLKSPQWILVNLFDRICSSQDNFNVNFDDAAASSTLPCPPTDGLKYRPNSPLSTFNGQSSSGNWTLIIEDKANLEGGVLTKWGLELCVTNPVGIKETVVVSPSYVFPNPTNGLLNVQLGGEESEEMKVKLVNTLGQIIETTVSKGASLISFDVSNYSSGVYQLVIEGKHAQQHEKIVITD